MRKQLPTKKRKKKWSLQFLQKIVSGVVIWLAAAWFCALSVVTKTTTPTTTTTTSYDSLSPNDSAKKKAVVQAKTNSKHKDNKSDNEQRYGISPIKLKLPTPVLVVGYPKSGTTSVWNFFNCSGVISQHFCCCGSVSPQPPCPDMARCIIRNMRQNNRTMLQDCGTYDVYAQLDGERWTQRLRPQVIKVLLENGTDEIVDNRIMRPVNQEMRHFLPQHFYLERLLSEFPHATLVLPLRDPYEWAHSVFNWFEMRGRIINEYLYQSQGRLQRPGRDGAVEFLARLYQEHAQWVRDAVVAKTTRPQQEQSRDHDPHPHHALIEFDIGQENAGKILASAFGLPETCWHPKNEMGSRAKTAKSNYTRQKQKILKQALPQHQQQS